MRKMKKINEKTRTHSKRKKLRRMKKEREGVGDASHSLLDTFIVPSHNIMTIIIITIAL